MADFTIDSAKASDMTNRVDDVEIDTEQLDTAYTQKETTYSS